MSIRADISTFAEQVLEAGGTVLVDFYSDGCVACRMLAPVLGEIEDTYEDSLKVVKVNVGVSLELAEQYNIAAAPTLICFAGGEELWRKSGFISQAELEEALRERVED